ncbi:unnamed protein product [Oppiella nova]|uniref:Complex 1 LYR protein domain-containing protein n=1 Tax=Oppiella nova TaxID=334625 RepID=A0A7R9QQQ8_9ACAR|nr:unnamed protein product [Oppiella nova]CAG2171996.1 unnamed protein product [Oppiella nova]
MGRRLPSNALTLSQFLLRQQTLRLYKDFMKLIRRTDNHKELRDWIRHEFRTNMHHKQQDIIKMQLTRGRVALKQWETTITLNSAFLSALPFPFAPTPLADSSAPDISLSDSLSSRSSANSSADANTLLVTLSKPFLLRLGRFAGAPSLSSSPDPSSSSSPNASSKSSSIPSKASAKSGSSASNSMSSSSAAESSPNSSSSALLSPSEPSSAESSSSLLLLEDFLEKSL